MVKKLAVMGAGAIIFLSGCSSSGSTTATPTPSATSTPTFGVPGLLKAKTKSFFDEYMLCMTKPPAEAKDYVGDYCQSHNSNATQSLPANLKLGGVSDAGADPILCAQNVPESFSVGMGFLDPEGVGNVMVIQNFSSDSKVFVNVRLQNDSGEYLVDNIQCAVE